MPQPQTQNARPRRRRWLWLLAAGVLILLLLFTPPLVNVSRLRRRIAASMSQSLGRPVHLDDVSLTLLPFPGFTFQNLVVSEDPAFGSEPMIRANTVTARLRLASLWRHQVEFSSIRFGVDANGSGPSVNLVRRADGRWNIENLLVHAAQADAAPTAQPRAGRLPRFPYIEATGARINIKNGVDKLPFALTEADFALWLPSPETWKVRLEGRPNRTDTTISDAGLLRAEATLGRAARAADVPVTVTASWSATPLGELSRMATGSDAGWRGTSEVNASLHGTLGAAALDASVKLRGLRRTEFIPARMLDLDLRCQASLATVTAVMTAPQCDLSKAPQHRLTLGETNVPSATLLAWSASSLDLSSLQATGVKVTSPGMPADFLLDAARLLTPRIAPDLRPAGTVLASFNAAGPPGWQGSATVTLPEMPAGMPAQIALTARDHALSMPPVPLLLDGKVLPLLVSATADPTGYRFTLTGSATREQITQVVSLAPALADGVLDAAFSPPTADGPTAIPQRLDLACTRLWWQPQQCASIANVTPPHPHRRKR